MTNADISTRSWIRYSVWAIVPSEGLNDMLMQELKKIEKQESKEARKKKK